MRALECATTQYREDAGAEPLSARPNYPKRGSHLKALQAPQKRAQSRSGGVEADILESVAPPLYFEAIAGVFVPAHGGTINCPLPDHDDRTPSCRVWPDPGAGWHCFGCGRGGTVIDLAAYLTGLEPRGSGYIQIREYAAERLLGKDAACPV